MEEEGGQRLRTVWWSCKFAGIFCVFFNPRRRNEFRIPN